MFEFIDASTYEDALPAVHDSIRFIRCWAARAVAGKAHVFDDLSPEQSALATRIVSEIETREGVPVSKLPLSKIEDYTNMIFERLQVVLRRDRNPDPVRGKVLLDQLRLVGK